MSGRQLTVIWNSERLRATPQPEAHCQDHVLVFYGDNSRLMEQLSSEEPPTTSTCSREQLRATQALVSSTDLNSPLLPLSACNVLPVSLQIPPPFKYQEHITHLQPLRWNSSKLSSIIQLLRCGAVLPCCRVDISFKWGEWRIIKGGSKI